MAKPRKRTESASGTDTSTTTAPDQVSSQSGFDNGGASGDHRDRVAMRAYELFLARGGSDGADFDDWLAAERELGSGNGNMSRGDAGE